MGEKQSKKKNISWPVCRPFSSLGKPFCIGLVTGAPFPNCLPSPPILRGSNSPLLPLPLASPQTLLTCAGACFRCRKPL